MSFNWKMAQDRALATKIRHEKCKAKPGVNPTFALEHAQECKEAAQGHFTLIEKRVKQEHEKFLEKYERKIKN